MSNQDLKSKLPRHFENAVIAKTDGYRYVILPEDDAHMLLGALWEDNGLETSYFIQNLRHYDDNSKPVTERYMELSIDMNGLLNANGDVARDLHEYLQKHTQDFPSVLPGFESDHTDNQWLKPATGQRNTLYRLVRTLH
ncbi:MAG: hypothetical protein H6868_03470 [Rhodospirillales bacterium]|nr:hypothetical protein [Rhodospirillales bacterium]